MRSVPTPTLEFALAAAVALGTPRAYLLDTATYSYLATHTYLQSIPAEARVASVDLVNVTTAGGVFDADDVSFSVPGGAPTCEAVVIVIWTGNAATSRILYYDDESTGLPTAANKTTFPVTWSNGSNKIFRF